MQELPEGAGVTPRVSPRSSSLTAGDILAPAPFLLGLFGVKSSRDKAISRGCLLAPAPHPTLICCRLQFGVIPVKGPHNR